MAIGALYAARSSGPRQKLESTLQHIGTIVILLQDLTFLGGKVLAV